MFFAKIQLKKLIHNSSFDTDFLQALTVNLRKRDIAPEMINVDTWE